MRTVFVLVLAACSAATVDDFVDSGDSGDTSTTPTTGPSWPPCDPTATEQVVSFVHVNDIHGGYGWDPPYDGESRPSRLVGYKESVLRENPYTVWTDGGDDFEKGSVVEDLSDGEAVTEIIQAMRFDVRAMGNHDFAFGPDIALPHTQDPHALVLASNSTYVGDEEGAWGAVPSVKLQVGCVAVGMYSMVTTPYITKGGCLPGIDGECHYFPGVVENTFDHFGAVEKLTSELKEEVDLVVALNHFGMDWEGYTAGVADGLDLALASHSHNVIREPWELSGARIVQAGSGGNYILRMDVTVDLTTGEPTAWDYELVDSVKGQMPVDDATEQAVQSVFDRWAPGVHTSVGWTTAPLSRAEATALLAERMVALHDDLDVAFLRDDHLKAGLPGGGVSLQDFFDTANHEREPPGTPSWTSLWKGDISGADLKRVIAAAGSNWHLAGIAPEAIVDETTYTLLSQKRAIELPQLFLPEPPLDIPPVVSDIEVVAEVWRAWHDVAEARNEACLFLDNDATNPDCP